MAREQSMNVLKMSSNSAKVSDIVRVGCEERRIKLTSLHELVNYTVKWAIPSADLSVNGTLLTLKPIGTNHLPQVTLFDPVKSLLHMKRCWKNTYSTRMDYWVPGNKLWKETLPTHWLPMSEELARTESVNLKSGGKIMESPRHEICSQPAGGWILPVLCPSTVTLGKFLSL